MVEVYFESEACDQPIIPFFHRVQPPRLRHPYTTEIQARASSTLFRNQPCCPRSHERPTKLSATLAGMMPEISTRFKATMTTFNRERALSRPLGRWGLVPVAIARLGLGGASRRAETQTLNGYQWRRATVGPTRHTKEPFGDRGLWPFACHAD